MQCKIFPSIAVVANIWFVYPATRIFFFSLYFITICVRICLQCSKFFRDNYYSSSVIVLRFLFLSTYNRHTVLLQTISNFIFPFGFSSSNFCCTPYSTLLWSLNDRQKTFFFNVNLLQESVVMLKQTWRIWVFCGWRHHWSWIVVEKNSFSFRSHFNYSVMEQV